MIALDHVTKKYNNHVIFQEASVTFKENEINFILGANGSGKTTLFKCILKLEDYSGIIKYSKSDSYDI